MNVKFTVHSVNLQKWWTSFEECWHICARAGRILIHLERVSSLILPEWFEISNYFKNTIQKFSEDMTFVIPSYQTRRGTVFHLILYSVEWIKICWKLLMFNTSPFFKNKIRFRMSSIQKLSMCHSVIRY